MVRNMKRDLNLGSRDAEAFNLRGDKCPICFTGLNGNAGVLCPKHAILICSNYNWLKDYINNLEKLNGDTIYILSLAISDRISYIINYVEVVNGKLQLKEHLEKEMDKPAKKKSLYMERKLREIIALQKARQLVIERIEQQQ